MASSSPSINTGDRHRNTNTNTNTNTSPSSVISATQELQSQGHHNGRDLRYLGSNGRQYGDLDGYYYNDEGMPLSSQAAVSCSRRLDPFENCNAWEATTSPGNQSPWDLYDEMLDGEIEIVSCDSEAEEATLGPRWDLSLSQSDATIAEILQAESNAEYSNVYGS